MKNDSQELMKLVMQDRVLEVKKVFDSAVQKKIAEKVSNIRKNVAKELFKKK